MIPFNKPYCSGRELKYMEEVCHSTTMSGNGDFTKKCHTFFEEKYGFKKCLLTTSGTDALEMCAMLCNLQPGDEVIIPSYTFVSTGLGCTPPIRQYSIPASRKDCFTLSNKPLRTTDPPPYTIITFRAPCFRANAPTCISVALPNTNSVGL